MLGKDPATKSVEFLDKFQRAFGGSATLANFDLFFSMEYDSIILKTHLIPVRGLKNCIFNASNASAIPLSDRFVTEQQWQ